MNVKIVTLCVACALLSARSSATVESEAHFLALVSEHENIVAIRCILNIMKKEIPCSTVVTLVYSNDDVDFLVETINNSECYTVIIRSFNDYNWLIKTSAYVIITENVEELAFGMSLITIDSFWNPRARIIAHAHNITYRDVDEVFNIFMKYRTYNVIFITNKETDAEVFTYFPFENGACGKKFNDAYFMTYCNDFTKIVNFFPNKYEGQMRNCNITVLVNDDMPNIIVKTIGNRTVIRGIEKYLLESMAKVEGLHLRYQITTPEQGVGVVLPNHTATGSLALLQNNEADIAAGGYILIQNRADVFDFIYGFNFASYNLYTAALDEPVWKELYIEFDIPTWALLLVSFAIIIVVTITVLNLAPKMRNSHSDLILKLWGFFYMGNSSGNLLKIIRLRLLMTCWIWFTFFIANFYTTALYSLITAYVEPVHHIGPDNLDSLPLKPCVSKSIRQLFQFAHNQTLAENEPIRNCCYANTALDTVASRTDLYTIAMTYSYVVREHQFIDDEGNRMLDAWSFSDDNILTIHLARGFPLRDRFQTLALQMYEGGFLQYYADYILHKSRSSVPSNPTIFRNIRLADLKNHYILLTMGSIASIICLIIEIYIHKRKANSDTVIISYRK